MSDAVRRVVVAAVLVRNDRLLLCHRRDDAPWYPGVWDLPGGHVEPGETAEQAMVRECVEELGIEVTRYAPHSVVRSAELMMTVFHVDEWTGEPHNAAPHEHRSVDWHSLGDITRLRLADARLESLARGMLGFVPPSPTA